MAPLDQRKNRALVNSVWISVLPHIEADFSAERLSDHTPCCILLVQDSGRKRASCFRYCNIWSTDDSFLPTVQRVRTQQFSGSSMFQLLHKLKMLRVELMPLRNGYSDALHKVDVLRDELTCAQNALALSPHDHMLQAQETKLKNDFAHWRRVVISIMNQRIKED